MNSESQAEGQGRRSSIRRALTLSAVLILSLILAAIFISRWAAYAAPQQPLAFSHVRHDEAGVECLYCHPNPLRSEIAGIPSVQKCMGCHQVIATDSPLIQQLTGYWERGEPIPWQPVTEMADHVYFSHQPHLQKGVSCDTCHGSVSQMTIARPAVIMDMGWCLDCHLDQPEGKVARLADCLACHK